MAHRIDTSTAQKDKFGVGKNGFTRGNPQTGVPATELDDDYFDMLQEEIIGIVEAAGDTLDKTRRNQLHTALNKLFQTKTGATSALGALIPAANRLPYFTGASGASLTELTTVGRDILASATKAAVLEYLGLSETIDLAKNALSKTGTAVAATKLATARTINGVPFHGTANITIPTFGAGTWTDVTASRTTSTLYTNTIGSALIVSVYTDATTANQVVQINGFVNSSIVYASAVGGGGTTQVTKTVACLLIVPPGATYSVSVSNATVAKWSELR